MRIFFLTKKPIVKLQNSLRLSKKLSRKYKDEIENEMVMHHIPLLISPKANSCNKSILYAKLKGSNEVQETNYFNKDTNTYKKLYQSTPMSCTVRVGFAYWLLQLPIVATGN